MFCNLTLGNLYAVSCSNCTKYSFEQLINVFYSYSGCNVWPNDDQRADDEVHNIITIHSYSLLTKSELHKLQYPQRQHQGNDKNSTSAEVRWMVGGRWWSEDRNSWHVNAGSSCNAKQAIAHYSLSNKSRFKSITVVDTLCIIQTAFRPSLAHPRPQHDDCHDY